MRIDNFYLSHIGIGAAEGKSAIEAPGKTGGPAKPSADATVHTLSPELTHLIGLVGKEPEVRAEAVRQAKDRLSQGNYLTQSSAEQTAAAILQANE